MVPTEKDAFLELVMGARSLSDLRDVADEVMKISNVNEQRTAFLLGSQANPLFIPRSTPATPINAFQLNYFISQARMAAANGKTDRIVVSSPMKSGSTFISDMIGNALDLPKASLMMMIARPYDYTALGAGNRSHEIDELWAKVVRGLDYLNANLPKTGKSLHGGHFALAALLGYLELRFPGRWEKGRGKLKNWPKKFEKFFSDYERLKPQA